MAKEMKIKTMIASLAVAALGIATAFAQEDTRQAVWLSQAQCREMALANNESMEKAGNAAEQAKMDKRVALASWFPQIDGSATGAYMFDNLDIMGMELQMKGMYMAGITLQQPLYAGGKLVAGTRLAKIGQECAVENQRKTRMEVLSQADNAYWTYLATLKKVGMMEAYSALMDTLCQQLQSTVDVQMATDKDLLQVKAKQSEIRYQLQKVRSGVELCRMALCSQIGLSLDTAVFLSDTILNPMAPELGEVSIENRPELALLQKQVEARKQQSKMVLGDMLPTAGLALGYTYIGNIDLNTSVNTGVGTIPVNYEMDFSIPLAMVAVRIPITEWGAGSQKMKKAKLEVRNAELDLAQNERLLTMEARQAALNLREGYMLIGTARLSVEHAKESLRVMRQRYDLQMCSLGDLLDAHAQWQQAESDLIEAQTQYKIYETEYLRTTGNL